MAKVRSCSSGFCLSLKEWSNHRAVKIGLRRGKGQIVPLAPATRIRGPGRYSRARPSARLAKPRQQIPRKSRFQNIPARTQGKWDVKICDIRRWKHKTGAEKRS